jgi:hypothetical protein
MEVTALGLAAPTSNRRETNPVVPNPNRRRSIAKATILLAKSRMDLIGRVKRIVIARAEKAKLRKK